MRTAKDLGCTAKDLQVKDAAKCFFIENSENGVFETTMSNIKDCFFTLRHIEEPKDTQVFEKSHFNQCDKTYTVINYAGTSEKYLKGTRKVYINFTF